jgi:hypothetical protein
VHILKIVGEIQQWNKKKHLGTCSLEKFQQLLTTFAKPVMVDHTRDKNMKQTIPSYSLHTSLLFALKTVPFCIILSAMMTVPLPESFNEYLK